MKAIAFSESRLPVGSSAKISVGSRALCFKLREALAGDNYILRVFLTV